MGKIIGIDLGTTNSLAACWKDGKSVLIPNSLGQYLTPSVVSIDENGIVYVGEIAKERLVTHPECTVNVFKRSMGTDRKYMLGDKEYSSDQLSALVLNSLKLDAERFLGEPVEEAVISVPAYFGDKARKATRNAGILAGLKVDRIVNEPSAAALAYKCMNDLPDGKLMVYDFGGGTLDVSLVDCFENVVEIIAVNGDNRLGGADFDTVLAEYFCTEQGLNLHQLDKSTQGIVIRAAERAKRVLTVSEDAEMKVSCDKLNASLIITRKKLIQLSMKLFNRMSVPVKAVLQDGQLSSSQLLGAVLVGGSCKMPVVQQYLRFLLKDVNIKAVNPDYMVALGVGMFAGLKESGGKAQDVILTDICPFSLGTNVLNMADPKKDMMSVIIPRNSPLPSSRVQSYCTVSDNQSAMIFGIYQGEDMYVNNNIRLSEIRFDNLPALPKGEVRVAVRFTYDINGILCVDATVLNTGEEQNLILGADDQSEETKRKIAELSELKKDVREIDSIKLIEERAQRIYQQLTVMTVKAELSARIQQFSMLLVAQDIYQLRKEAAIFSSYLDEIENNYLSESGIDDGYMDDFLQWYEENGENDEPQGWTP